MTEDESTASLDFQQVAEGAEQATSLLLQYRGGSQLLPLRAGATPRALAVSGPG